MRGITFQTLPIAITTLLLCFTTIIPIQPTHAISGCEWCEQTGDCSAAFRSGPGQYCGQWMDYNTNHKRPCCCPNNSMCKLSSTSCKCHIAPPGYNPPPSPSPPSSSSSSYNSHSSSSYYGQHIKPDIIDMLGFAIALTLFTCCCCLCIPKFIRGFKRAMSSSEQDVPFTPYDDYDHPPPPPMNPEYHHHHQTTPVVTGMPVSTVPSYGSTATTGGGGVGSNVLSAVGGLAAGTVLGNMIAHRMDYNEGGNSGYRDVAAVGGGGGGYDIVGDSGGGDDVVVDTGGGFDFAGDDGGGDFDGDF